METNCCNGAPGSISVIPIKNNGKVKTTLSQNRRRISTSSSFSSSATETVRGSSAMPQIGQLPGASRMISGCIGQVYSTFCFGGATVSDSNAIPHLGQEPVLSERTSGCIGQVNSVD